MAYNVLVKRPYKVAKTIEIIINNYLITIGKSKKAREGIQQFEWKIVNNKFIEIFEEAMST